MTATTHSLIPRDFTENLSVLVVEKVDLYSGHEAKWIESSVRGYIQLFQDKFQDLAVKQVMAEFSRILSLQQSLANRKS
jgi:hypothetical protein